LLPPLYEQQSREARASRGSGTIPQTSRDTSNAQAARTAPALAGGLGGGVAHSATLPLARPRVMSHYSEQRLLIDRYVLVLWRGTRGVLCFLKHQFYGKVLASVPIMWQSHAYRGPAEQYHPVSFSTTF
jgi:hypothetical protein